ncbi:MAG: SDR family NAD(P)-dependent oxidoreductase, partial [Bacteroidota bacterium]
MRSQTILITGGNDGIGRATAQVLLERGHRVVIAGRSEPKMEAAVATLKYRTGSRNVDWIHCDLSDLGSVRSAAKTWAVARPIPSFPPVINMVWLRI